MQDRNSISSNTHQTLEENACVFFFCSGIDIGEMHQMLLRSRGAVPKIKINVGGHAVEGGFGTISEEQSKEKPSRRRKSSASQPKDDSMFEGHQDESESKGKRTAVIRKKKKKKHKRRSQDAILVVDKSGQQITGTLTGIFKLRYFA